MDFSNEMMQEAKERHAERFQRNLDSQHTLVFLVTGSSITPEVSAQSIEWMRKLINTNDFIPSADEIMAMNADQLNTLWSDACRHSGTTSPARLMIRQGEKIRWVPA